MDDLLPKECPKLVRQNAVYEPVATCVPDFFREKLLPIFQRKLGKKRGARLAARFLNAFAKAYPEKNIAAHKNCDKELRRFYTAKCRIVFMRLEEARGSSVEAIKVMLTPKVVKTEAKIDMKNRCVACLGVLGSLGMQSGWCVGANKTGGESSTRCMNKKCTKFGKKI